MKILQKMLCDEIRGNYTLAYIPSFTCHLGKPSSIHGGVAPGFSHVEIVPDGAAVRRDFSGISRFPSLLHFSGTPYSPRFTYVGSQELDIRPFHVQNIFTLYLEEAFGGGPFYVYILSRWMAAYGSGEFRMSDWLGQLRTSFRLVWQTTMTERDDCTEQSGSVAKTMDSHSGERGFNSQSDHPDVFSRGLLTSVQANAELGRCGQTEGRRRKPTPLTDPPFFVFETLHLPSSKVPPSTPWEDLSFNIIATACRDVLASTCRSSETTLHNKYSFLRFPASSLVAQPAVSAGPTRVLFPNRTEGATVVEWLACSPPTKTNRVRKWESCRTMSLVGGFSRGSPVSPPLHYGTVPYSLQSPSSAL
ncbi:hypothetical protein PR048_017495 [Dryococelus australis]|uniref:Uncharacterized protein n=1 Tax=Dryococelus australis TaxID=614101 RepID=A0ABQ9H9N3_9NEOP|nr:hypothetical protein PR048_017495 [Dryococelus australis]